MATMNASLSPLREPGAAARPAATPLTGQLDAQLALAELFPDLRAAADAALAEIFPALRLRGRTSAGLRGARLA